MSAEHRRPLVAFVAVSILCAVMLGYGVRSDAFSGLLGPRVSSSAAQNQQTVTVRDTATAVAPATRATGLPGLSAERVVTAAPAPTSAPTPTATAVVQPAAPATVVPIPVTTPTATPTPPPAAVTPEVDDQGAQPAVVAARKAVREAAKQARKALKEATKAAEKAAEDAEKATETAAKEADKALEAAARAAAKATKHGLVQIVTETVVPAP